MSIGGFCMVLRLEVNLILLIKKKKKSPDLIIFWTFLIVCPNIVRVSHCVFLWSPHHYKKIIWLTFVNCICIKGRHLCLSCPRLKNGLLLNIPLHTTAHASSRSTQCWRRKKYGYSPVSCRFVFICCSFDLSIKHRVME